MTRRTVVYLGLTLLAAVSFVFASPGNGTVADAPAAKRAPVRLAVVVVVDQLQADYLTRFGALYGDGGFQRLKKDGAWFTNCHYPYATTVTGAGHATISTGCLPSQHGIIGNEWYRHDNLALVYCAASTERHRIPPPDKPTKKEEDLGSGSPENLKAATIGEALKSAYEKSTEKPRVISLSFKDRSAVLLGGTNVDGAYWLDADSGTFVTSDYYRDSLPAWVKEFNGTKPADVWFAKDWTPLKPDVDKKYYWPSDPKWAGEGIKQGTAFPHPTTGGLDKPGKRYYDALAATPFGNELLFAFAKTAIEKEGLGTRDTPDLLLVSFSSNDIIGHAWGPDSPEVLDVTLRTDALLKDLLTYLDDKVGKEKYVLVLCADHGVCPLPEVTAAKKKANPSLPLPDADRLDVPKFRKDAEAFLHEAFVQPADDKVVCISRFSDDAFYLNPQWVKETGLRPEKIETRLADWLKRHPGILTAYTRTTLENGAIAPGDEIGEKVSHSFQPARSGDVIFVMLPYWWVTTEKYKTGTGHGTPHGYDTHVPFLVYGGGVRPGIHTDAVTPLAAVPILARALNVPPPATAKTPVPPKLFAD
jgi:hypothetical protein